MGLCIVAFLSAVVVSASSEYSLSFGDYGSEAQDNVTNTLAEQLPTAFTYNATENDLFDDMDEWVGPAYLHHLFPYEVTGNDEEGSAVYINHYGKWNYSQFVRDHGNLEEFEKYSKQLLHRFMRDAEKANGAIIIFDFDGFSLANFANQEALRLSVQQFSTLDKITAGLKFGFAINTNYPAHIFVNIVRPFLGTFLEKVEIFGPQRDKWIPNLLKKIPREALPKYYGGIL